MNSTSLQILEETHYSLFFFVKVLDEASKNSLNWYRNVGLIADSYECPDCGKNMKMVETENKYGYEWQCVKTHGKNQHKTSRSVIKNSCFSYSPLNVLNLFDNIYLMNLWYCNFELERIKHESGIDNEMMIAECLTFYREICLLNLINNSEKIGGKNVRIEMDICKLGEMKYVKEKFPIGQWVLGCCEKKSNRLFFRIMESNSKEKLLKVICEWVKPGSIIILDCLESYISSSDEDFISFCMANDLTFQESDRYKSIEAARSVFEGTLKNKVDVVLDSKLGEYLWRKKYEKLHSYTAFRVFLKCVIENYQPLCKDKQL